MDINVIDKLDAKFNDEYSRLYIILGLVWSVCAGLDHATTDYALSTFSNVQELNPLVLILGLEATLLIRILLISIGILILMYIEDNQSQLLDTKQIQYIELVAASIVTSALLITVIHNSYIIYILSI